MARPATKEHFGDWNMGSQCLISCHTCRLPYNMAVQNWWSCLWKACQTIFTWSSSFEIPKEKPPPPLSLPHHCSQGRILHDHSQHFEEIHFKSDTSWISMILNTPPPSPRSPSNVAKRGSSRMLFNVLRVSFSSSRSHEFQWPQPPPPPSHCSQGRILKDPYQRFGEILLQFNISWIPMTKYQNTIRTPWNHPRPPKTPIKPP
jgi:hypothetical protein